MQLKFEQLAGQLQKSLAKVYLLTGDEPWQMLEAADNIRAAAKQAGFTERETFFVDKSFDWQQLVMQQNHLSLFGSRRILELRMGSARPGKAGSEALRAFCADPPEDVLLLIQASRLEARERQAAWVKTLDQAGVTVPMWPLDLRQTHQFIAERMRSLGLEADAESVSLLAEKVEGNLLAAVQEIEKLRLCFGAGAVDSQQLMAAVGDSARFNVFDLVDAALAGDCGRSLRILEGLRQEGAEPVLVLWGLSREIRQLLALAEKAAAGTPAQQVLSTVRPTKRQGIVRQALRRHPRRQLGILLRRCAQVDRAIKGQATLQPWEALADVCQCLAGSGRLMRSA